MNTILQAIRITTDDGTGTPMPITDSTRGILNGEFHFITGETSFLDNQDLTGDGIDTEDDQYWYSGFTIKDAMANPIRAVDIVDGGSWGAQSGFAFRLDNTNTDAQAFWAWAKAEGIDFVNRKVVLYYFVQETIGGAWESIQRWTGIISEDPFTSTEFTIQCSGADPAQSRLIPNASLTRSSYPGLVSTQENAVTPIALGYVERAQAVKVTSPQPIALGVLQVGVDTNAQQQVFSSFAVAYRTPANESPYLVVWTPQAFFGLNELAGFYLQLLKGGSSINITGNEATSIGAEPNGYGIAYLTKMYLSNPLEDVTEDDFANSFDNAPDAWDADKYYSIEEAVKDSDPNLYTWLSLQNNNIDHTPAVGVWWNRQRAIVGDYSGQACPLFINIFFATNISTDTSKVGPYLIGETSGASGIAFNAFLGTSGVFMVVRGMFLKTERAYVSVEPRYYGVIKDDENGTLGGIQNVRGWIAAVNTAASNKIYAWVSASGSNRTFILTKNNSDPTSSPQWVASVTYTTPGVKTLTTLNSSGVFGTVEILNTLATPTPVNAHLIEIDLHGVQVNAANSLATITNIVLDSLGKPVTGTRNYTYTTTEYFALYKNYLDYIVSLNPIGEYVGNYAAIYNSANNEYVDITSLVTAKSLSGNEQYNGPFISLASGQADNGSTFLLYAPLIPPVASFGLNLSITPVPELVDRDRTTYVTVSGAPIGSNAAGASFELKIFPPADLFTKSYESIFAAIDMEVVSASAFYFSDFRIVFFDKNGLRYYETQSFGFPLDGLSFSPGTLNNLLPNLYYNNGGDDDGEASQFGRTFSDQLGAPIALNSKLQIPEEIISGMGADFGYAAFIVTARTPPQSSQATIAINIKQAGYVGANKIDVSQDSLYVRAIGEHTNADETVLDVRTAYEWFMDKMNLPVGSTNLSEVASQMPIGRNLLENRSGREWLTELARQGFFCVFPDRKGFLSAINWLLRSNAEDVTFNDDASNILTGSISLDKSDYKRLWNTFNFLYHYDPARGKYTGRLAIQKPEASAYPSLYASTVPGGDASKAFTSITVQYEGGVWVAYVVSAATGISIGDVFSFYGSDIGASIYFSPVTSVSGTTYRLVMEQNFSGSAGVPSSVGTWLKQGSATPAWTEYVSGLPGTAGWAAGKPLWEFCHESYLKTLSIQEAPGDLTVLSYFIDLSKFYEDPNAQTYENFAAYAIANFHVRYTTRQRNIYNYSIPMTKATLKRELLELGTVEDFVFTEDEARLGWMFSVEDDLQSDSLKIKVMGLPGDVTIGNGNIIELGNATDDLVEEGDTADNVVETGEA